MGCVREDGFVFPQEETHQRGCGSVVSELARSTQCCSSDDAATCGAFGLLAVCTTNLAKLYMCVVVVSEAASRPYRKLSSTKWSQRKRSTWAAPA